MTGGSHRTSLPPGSYFEVRLEPSRILSAAAVSVDDVPRAEVRAFRDVLDAGSGCADCVAEVDFLDLEGVVVNWRVTDGQTAIVVISMLEVHLGTVWLFLGGDSGLDRQDLDGFHEGLTYLALRFPLKRATLSIDALPDERPAVFMVMLDDDLVKTAMPTLLRLIRAFAVAFFERAEHEVGS